MNEVINRNWLRPVRPGDEIIALENLAREDNHELIAPTHVFVKGGELAGYCSLGAMPLVLPWFHSRKLTARDSLYFINQLENLAANLIPQQQSGFVFVPVPTNSPFAPHMAKLGYVNAGTAMMTLKKVR